MGTALFIDGNTINEKYFDVIINEASGIGDIIISKTYGAFGKENRASMELVADMVRAFENEFIDTVLVATFDEHISPILSLLKEKGKRVIVIGSVKDCDRLINESSNYIYIEALLGESLADLVTPVSSIAGAVLDIISYYKGHGNRPSARELYEALQRKYKDFDTRNYGYTHFETFINNEVKGAYTDYADNVLYIDAAEDNKEIEGFIYSYIAGKGNKLDDMQELFDALAKEYKGFSTSHYGYNSEYAFILSFPKLAIEGNKGIRLKQTFKLSENVEE